jgi:membrane-bound lytic murein transglycosylase A
VDNDYSLFRKDVFMSPLNKAVFSALALSIALLGGCSHKQTQIVPQIETDIDKPVEGWGLRKLDPSEYPDMKAAWADKTNLERAIDKSLQYLELKKRDGSFATAHFYPSNNPGDTITHAQVRATLYDIKHMLHENMTPEQFQEQLATRYDVYTSKGYNDKGDVWFTGYYTPVYQGSLTPTSEYQYPVYRRPADLHSDPITGEVIGSYPTRRELVSSGKLRGLELVYFKKPIEPFIIQVQGSAKVMLPNGKPIYLGYAGHNGGQHRGLGSELVKEGKIDKKHLSLPAVLQYFDEHPDELNDYMMRDDRFVFLKEYSSEWPAGSLGVQVTADRTLATDKSIFPRASLTFIDVPKPTMGGETLPYRGFVLDQDTGGAIRAAGRADIYMGIGEAAGKLAGHQYAQGRLYYLFLKPSLIGQVGDLRPAPMPKNVTPGTPRKGKAPAGTDEMFPGAVKR